MSKFWWLFLIVLIIIVVIMAFLNPWIAGALGLGGGLILARKK
ncbi:MAG: hypothetical protein ACK5LM_02520 [Lactovum sp.]